MFLWPPLLQSLPSIIQSGKLEWCGGSADHNGCDSRQRPGPKQSLQCFAVQEFTLKKSWCEFYEKKKGVERSCWVIFLVFREYVGVKDNLVAFSWTSSWVKQFCADSVEAFWTIWTPCHYLWATTTLTVYYCCTQKPFTHMFKKKVHW